MGRTLIVAGLALAAIGVLLVLGEKLPWKPGRLPGDIVIEGERGSFHFPIVTCAILSILLTLGAWLFKRFMRH